jgi:hypothetical protein
MKAEQFGERPRKDEIEGALSLKFGRAVEHVSESIAHDPRGDGFIQPQAMPKVNKATRD